VRFLVDTNVLSEIRKRHRGDANVVRWAASQRRQDLYTSVLVLGEIRLGVERARRRDPDKALVLERWLHVVRQAFEGRILSVDGRVAEEWGRLNTPRTLPVVDGLLAATAKVHELVVATRNVADLAASGVPTMNPFEAPDR
jgi:predicted nucleic acid-binding protein